MDKKYLDKIVRYLVEDTGYTSPKDASFRFGDLISISFPFAQISYYYTFEEIKDWIESGWYMDDDVLEFLNGTYGLDEKESTYVMNKYIKNICRKILNDFKSNPINESIDKMDHYLAKVLQYLKDDTYLMDGGLINLPFLNQPVGIRYDTYSNVDIIYILNLINPPAPFERYCKNLYNIEGEFVNTLWRDYKTFLYLKLF